MGSEKIRLGISSCHLDGFSKCVEMINAIGGNDEKTEEYLSVVRKEKPELDSESLRIGFYHGLHAMIMNLEVSMKYLVEEIERGNT